MATINTIISGSVLITNVQTFTLGLIIVVVVVIVVLSSR